MQNFSKKTNELSLRYLKTGRRPQTDRRKTNERTGAINKDTVVETRCLNYVAI